jgi:hypothetical protein
LLLNVETGDFSPILKTLQIWSPQFFSCLILFNVFSTQNAVWQLKKRNAIKNLEKNYQERQTSAKSRNLLFKFKDFQLFFAVALAQLIFFNVFLTQCAVWQLKKKNPSLTWKKVIRTDKRAPKAGIFSSNLKIFNCFFLLLLCPNLFFWMFFWLNMLSDNCFPSFWW